MCVLQGLSGHRLPCKTPNTASGASRSPKMSEGFTLRAWGSCVGILPRWKSPGPLAAPVLLCSRVKHPLSDVRKIHPRRNPRVSLCLLPVGSAFRSIGYEGWKDKTSGSTKKGGDRQAWTGLLREGPRCRSVALPSRASVPSMPHGPVWLLKLQQLCP